MTLINESANGSYLFLDIGRHMFRSRALCSYAAPFVTLVPVPPALGQPSGPQTPQGARNNPALGGVIHTGCPHL